MGNVCDAFWPIARRHMAQADAQADAQAQELSALTLQNNVEDPADPLTSLPPELLQKPLKFLKLDDVHEAKPVSKDVRSAARSVIRRWRPVKFVAEHGEQLMWAAASAAQDIGALTPAERDWRALWDQPSSLALCQAAWARNPYETLRILFTWGHSESEAARFLALVEPSLDGLERIVRLCEPAHRFVYAKHQLARYWRGGPRDVTIGTTIDVIRRWARYIGTPFDEPTLKSLPLNAALERHNLVVSCISGALRSWTEPAVATDFFFYFFCVDDHDLWMVSELEDFTRDWDDDKASAFVAANTADLAASRLSAEPPWGCGLYRGRQITLFTEKVRQVEELLQLEELMRGRARFTPWGQDFAARPTYFKEGVGYLFLVEFACRLPGRFY